MTIQKITNLVKQESEKMTKKFLLIMVGLILIFSTLLYACAAPAPAPAPTPAPAPAPEKPAYQWRLGVIGEDPMSIRMRGAEMFAKLLKERSGGRIIVGLYPGNLLGDWTVQNELVAEGSLELTMGCMNPALDKKLNVNALNYMYFDAKGCRDAFMLPDGWLAKLLEPVATSSNFKVLYWMHEGWVGVHMTEGNLPRVDTVENWFADTAKMKIRCEPVKTMEKHTEAMGFKAVVLSFSEVYTALQTGAIDGWVGSGIGRAVQYSDVIRYRIEERGKVDAMPLMMNLDLFNSMSAEDQKILQDTSYEVQKWGFDTIEEDEVTMWLKKAQEVNVEIIQLAPAVLAEIIKRDRDIEWVYAEKELIGKEFMDAVRANAQKPPL